MEGIGGGLIYPDLEGSSSSAELDEQDMPFEVGNCTEEIYVRQNGSGWCNYTLFNDTYYYDDVEMYSLAFKIAIAILYNFVFVTALMGNALVCYVVFSSPRMRTVTNYLIANLAVGDLLMAVLCVPFSYIPVLLQYWPFGHFLCYLLSPAQAISVLVSSYTLVALAADRYMAILYPLRPRLRRSQACWVIAVVWLIAVITATPIAIFTEYYQDPPGIGRYYCAESGWKTMGVEDFKLPYGLMLMILQYFFPLIVLIFTYSRIAMAVWGKKSLGEAEGSRDQRLAKTKRKTVVMSLAVVAGYTLAWLPFNLMVLVGFDRILWYPQYVFFACHSLAMAHSTYNPVIYAWMNMIKMMLMVIIVYTVSWLPFNMFLIYGDIWNENLFVENHEIASYLHPIVHWLAMAHSVWNPVIYCYMNSRFRDGFRTAVSNVSCLWKLVHCCHLSSESNGNEHMMEISRRRSYCSTNRLTRTNTTCTTYTFGSGSLHNLHSTTANYHPYSHQVSQHNPANGGKHSYIMQPASTGNGRWSAGSTTLVSQLPRANNLTHHMSAPLPISPETVQRDSDGVNASTTMTSIAPAHSSSLQSSPSSESMVTFPMSSRSPGKNPDIDLNTEEHQQKTNITSGKGNGMFQSSSTPSYVSISRKGGKDQVVTTKTGVVGKGTNGQLVDVPIPPSFLSQKRSSTSSGVSESFM